MLKYIQNHGGIEKLKFKKLKIFDYCSKMEVEDELLNQYLEATVMRGKIVKSIVGTVTKRERCKQYNQINRQKHLKFVKDEYQKQRESILAKTKKKYSDKPKCYTHCEACNNDIVSTYYERHCSCVNHVYNIVNNA